MPTLRLAQGTTSPTDWHDLPRGGIRVTVDTRRHGFTQVPHYLCTLEGEAHMWKAQGVNAVYNPAINSFQVILKFVNERGADGKPVELTAAYAKTHGWYLRYTAVYSEADETASG